MSSNLNKYLQEDNHEPSQPTEAQTKRGQELARQYGLEAESPAGKVQHFDVVKELPGNIICHSKPEPPGEKVQPPCPCMVSGSGYVYRLRTPDCPNAPQPEPQQVIPEDLRVLYGHDNVRINRAGIRALIERLGAAEQRANESKMQDEAKAGYIQFIREGLHRLQKQFSDTRQDDEPGEAIEFIAGELGNVLQTMQERDDLEAERDRLQAELDHWQRGNKVLADAVADRELECDRLKEQLAEDSLALPTCFARIHDLERLHQEACLQRDELQQEAVLRDNHDFSVIDERDDLRAKAAELEGRK